MEFNDLLQGPAVLMSLNGESGACRMALSTPEPRFAPFAVSLTTDYECDSGIGAGEVIPGQGEDLVAEDGTKNQQEILIDPFYEDLEALDKAQGAIIQDPTTTERYFWRDPVTSLQREIWRPGDGDGDRNTDYFDKLGPKPPLEDRWRFFQSRVGPGPVKFGINEPPKYVILDDRAAQELLASDVPRTHLARYWSHDFIGNGSIRTKRVNRGRGAIGDFEACGIDRFHFTTVANKKNGEKYYFKGEQDYKTIIWNTNDVHLALDVFKPEVKKITSPPPPKRLKHNQHGHNQFTPRDELVKFGAKHKAANPRKPKNRVDDDGVRGGRNRAHNFIANHIGSPAAEERVENWRSTTISGLRSSNQQGRVTLDDSPGGSDGEEPTRESSEEEDEAAYVRQLEMHLVNAKELTDEQKAKIKVLKGALSKARDKIKLLEEELATFKQD